MTSTKKTLFALFRSEYNSHISQILTKRRMAHEYLNHFLVVRHPDEWVSFYGCLCEYVGVLYHFEEALEKITLKAEWDEPNEQWLMDENLAMGLVMLVTSEMMCREDLRDHNVSLELH